MNTENLCEFGLNGPRCFRRIPTYTCPQCCYSVCRSCYAIYLSLLQVHQLNQEFEENEVQERRHREEEDEAEKWIGDSEKRQELGDDDNLVEEQQNNNKSSASVITPSPNGSPAEKQRQKGERESTITTEQPQLYRCHQCHQGFLEFEEVPVHPWTCEGYLGMKFRHRRTDGGMYETIAAQQYEVIRTHRDKRRERRSKAPVVTFYGYRIHAKKEERRQDNGKMIRQQKVDVHENAIRTEDFVDSLPNLATTVECHHFTHVDNCAATLANSLHLAANSCNESFLSKMENKYSKFSTTSTASKLMKELMLPALSHSRQVYTCLEGECFLFSGKNIGVKKSLIFCAVSRATMSTRSCSSQLPLTILPICEWICPPSLENIPDIVFAMKLPNNCYRYCQEIMLVEKDVMMGLTSPFVNPEGGEKKSFSRGGKKLQSHHHHHHKLHDKAQLDALEMHSLLRVQVIHHQSQEDEEGVVRDEKEGKEKDQFFHNFHYHSSATNQYFTLWQLPDDPLTRCASDFTSNVVCKLLGDEDEENEPGNNRGRSEEKKAMQIFMRYIASKIPSFLFRCKVKGLSVAQLSHLTAPLPVLSWKENLVEELLSNGRNVAIYGLGSHMETLNAIATMSKLFTLFQWNSTCISDLWRHQSAPYRFSSSTFLNDDDGNSKIKNSKNNAAGHTSSSGSFWKRLHHEILEMGKNLPKKDDINKSDSEEEDSDENENSSDNNDEEQQDSAGNSSSNDEGENVGRRKKESHDEDKNVLRQTKAKEQWRSLDKKKMTGGVYVIHGFQPKDAARMEFHCMEASIRYSMKNYNKMCFHMNVRRLEEAQRIADEKMIARFYGMDCEELTSPSYTSFVSPAEKKNGNSTGESKRRNAALFHSQCQSSSAKKLWNIMSQQTTQPPPETFEGTVDGRGGTDLREVNNDPNSSLPLEGPDNYHQPRVDVISVRTSQSTLVDATAVQQQNANKRKEKEVLFSPRVTRAMNVQHRRGRQKRKRNHSPKGEEKTGGMAKNSDEHNAAATGDGKRRRKKNFVEIEEEWDSEDELGVLPQKPQFVNFNDLPNRLVSFAPLKITILEREEEQQKPTQQPMLQQQLTQVVASHGRNRELQPWHLGLQPLQLYPRILHQQVVEEQQEEGKKRAEAQSTRSTTITTTVNNFSLQKKEGESSCHDNNHTISNTIAPKARGDDGETEELCTAHSFPHGKHLVIVHDIDLLDVHLANQLALLCHEFPRHISVLVSFNNPNWLINASPIVTNMLRLELVHLSTFAPRLQETRHISDAEVIWDQVGPRGGAGGSGGGGRKGINLPMADTIRRTLDSIPVTFFEIFAFMVDYQQEIGANNFIAVEDFLTFLSDKHEMILQSNKVKQVLLELHSNRLIEYDPRGGYAVRILQLTLVSRLFQERKNRQTRN